MGGAYLYSFDIAVLLFGVCFNLAGLPYSAGFLGKEFLLFQVLRDDLVSLFVRGCWLVSFFFTPIYMFMLVFLVMFGPKKGTRNAYATMWHFKFNQQLNLINYALSVRNTGLIKNYWHRFQFTAITSRSTSLILLTFWLFFFTFGESLLLVIFNFSTLVDTIPSANFNVIKQHTNLSINSLSLQLTNTINFFISILTLLAFSYLLSLSYSSRYTYFRDSNQITTLLLLLNVVWLALQFLPLF